MQERSQLQIWCDMDGKTEGEVAEMIYNFIG